MIVLFVCALLIAGTVLGWFTHRAYMRIDAWGIAMNEQDETFRLASEEELEDALRRIRVVRFDGPKCKRIGSETAAAK